jgi:hypothetical protein
MLKTGSDKFVTMPEKCASLTDDDAVWFVNWPKNACINHRSSHHSLLECLWHVRNFNIQSVPKRMQGFQTPEILQREPTWQWSYLQCNHKLKRVSLTQLYAPLNCNERTVRSTTHSVLSVHCPPLNTWIHFGRYCIRPVAVAEPSKACLLAWKLGSWVRIHLKAWMSWCVYSVFMLLCVGNCLATISRPRSSTDCV